MPIRVHVLVSSATQVVSSSVSVCRLVAFHLSPLLLHLSYFLAIDLLGFLALVLLKPSSPGYRPRYVDLFFMSTSAATVTGLATVKMEDLSSSHIVVLTLLMLLGSEMFVSLLGLFLESRKQRRHDPDHGSSSRVRSSAVTVCDEANLEEANPPAPSSASSDDDRKESCLRSLAVVFLVYMAMILALGSLLVFVYVATVPSARDVLERKGINAALFSASVTVSSFTNGGLLPTNESMAAFAANRGLLLLLAGQIIAGNTLLPVFLRLVVWATRGLARAFAGRRGSEGLESMAEDAVAANFGHLLLPGLQTVFLAVTVVAVAAAAVTLLCCLNWDSEVFDGLTAGEKITNALFMAVNARQAGENSVDCSLVAPAVLVLFLSMMSASRSFSVHDCDLVFRQTRQPIGDKILRTLFRCIPATATFFSVHDGGGAVAGEGSGGEPEHNKHGAAKKRRSLSLNSMFLTPLACVASVTMLVCVTERRSLSGDPLNFSTFNMIFEVLSAYGNLGLSTGYSCSRLLRPEEASACHDKPYSFSGWWSDQGKLVLVLLMLYGRLKGFDKKRRRS
ncbi:putative cation transporter HKT9 [Panicum miliaceum]|uniref:Cation transporter HKT9 n=1 Tax=Panicum miliaceum TaxID=4540 RepID=A0A3L6PDA3_PANMI|nr:putative cation transporter HKT9 [Panicum miliaceum]